MEPTRSPLVLLVAQAVLAAAMLQQPSEGRVQAVAPSAPHLAGGKEAEAAAATSLPSSPFTGVRRTRGGDAASIGNEGTGGYLLAFFTVHHRLARVPAVARLPGHGRRAAVYFAFAAPGQYMHGAADTGGTVRQLPDELQRAGAAENVLRRLQVARRRRRQDLPVPRHHGRPGYICRRDDRPATHARAASNVQHVHTAGASSDVPRQV
uniref:Dirigent protein n=1 Tax=Aegilops tauschii TaxID=37682 RepID=M8B8K6_AEGTA